MPFLCADQYHEAQYFHKCDALTGSPIASSVLRPRIQIGKSAHEQSRCFYRAEIERARERIAHNTVCAEMRERSTSYTEVLIDQ